MITLKLTLKPATLYRVTCYVTNPKPDRRTQEREWTKQPVVKKGLRLVCREMGSTLYLMKAGRGFYNTGSSDNRT